MQPITIEHSIHGRRHDVERARLSFDDDLGKTKEPCWAWNEQILRSSHGWREVRLKKWINVSGEYRFDSNGFIYVTGQVCSRDHHLISGDWIRQYDDGNKSYFLIERLVED